MGASFFSDLSIVVVVAALVGLVFGRFNLPMTVGYILAGVLVGPNVGPTLIKDSANIQMLSDLGVMFLMFSIGLGFSFRKVRAMGTTIVFPAIADVVLMVVGGFLLGNLLGWGPLECFLLGMILCDSSTSIAAKTLEELGWVQEPFAERTFGIALLEDVLAILLIAVLNGVMGGENSGTLSTLIDVGKQILTLGVFLIGVIVLGVLLIPRLMDYVCEKLGDEMVLMVALGICCGIAYLAQEVLHLSLVVGAFLAGAVVAESKFRRRIERTVKPVSQLFSSVFFVSVGLMVKPVELWDNIGIIIFLTISMILLKLFNIGVSCLLMGNHPRDAFKTGLGMGQVAEFSFIIAGIAMSRGLSSRPLYQISVGVALLCTASNPYLLRGSNKIYDMLAKRSGRRLHELLRWYQSWFGGLQLLRTEGGQTVASKLRGQAARLALTLTIILVIFSVVYGIAYIPGIRELIAKLNSFAGGFPVAGCLKAMLSLLISAPAIWAILHNWEEMSHLMTASYGHKGKRWSLMPARAYVRSFLRMIGYVFLAVYLGMLSSIFVENFLILLVVLLTTGAYIVSQWRRLSRGYLQVHRTLARAFDITALPQESPESIDSIMKVHTETFEIPHNSIIVGKTLAEINLRKLTGVSVISMYNHASPTRISPGGDAIVHAGDFMVLCGSDAEITKAVQVLSQDVAQ